jgi:hypothetical protein
MTLEKVVSNSQLTQSTEFGELYAELLAPLSDSLGASDVLGSDDVEELYTKIVTSHDSLSEFHQESLGRLFIEFDKIRKLIDPNRLKSFEHFLNDDEELLLFRDTGKGLVNIIIHSEECIAFSYIPKGDGERCLYFVEDGDFEKLTYDFFAQ